MSDDSLEKIRMFHQEVAVISKAGLPLDLGFDLGELSDQFGRIESVLAEHQGRGESIERAIENDSEITTQHRTAMLAWLRHDDPTIALDQIVVLAVSRRQLGSRLGQWLVYPFLIVVVAYVAFQVLFRVTGPAIEAIYAQLAQANDQTMPNLSVSFLSLGRRSMPVWSALVPILLVAAVLWWRFRSASFTWSWLPGSSRYFDSIGRADFARRLARSIDGGESVDQALQTTHRVGADSDSLPPLLKWAVEDDLGGESRPRALRFVAKVYGLKAERQATVWRVIGPAMIGVFFGSLVVFGYGLSVFLPIIQLLKHVALPGGA